MVERFPEWVGTPLRFYMLSPEQQALLLGYELVREEEEALCR